MARLIHSNLFSPNSFLEEPLIAREAACADNGRLGTTGSENESSAVGKVYWEDHGIVRLGEEILRGVLWLVDLC